MTPIGPEIIYWIRDLIFTIYWSVKYIRFADLAICLDCWNCLAGLILKRVGIFKKVIYYTIDYSDKRFNHYLLDRLYVSLDRFCVKYADEIWDVSQAITWERYKYFPSDFIDSKTKLVPIGIDESEFSQSNIKRVPDRIVYFGSLFELMGIHLVIGAMPSVLEKIPDATFLIIGSGDYQTKLQDMIDKLDLNQHIRIINHVRRVDNIRELFKAEVAVATYTDSEGSYKKFCDPTKVKEYFAAGIPVVITRVPPIWKDIESKKMGFSVASDSSKVSAALIKLLTEPVFRRKCIENISTYIRGYKWNSIFNTALES